MNFKILKRKLSESEQNSFFFIKSLSNLEFFNKFRTFKVKKNLISRSENVSSVFISAFKSKNDLLKFFKNLRDNF